MKTRIALLVLGSLLLESPPPLSAESGPVVVPDAAVRRDVEVANVAAAPERVQGLVVNRSQATLKNLVLLVRYDWLWLNERRPGEDTMSFADTVAVPGDVPPGGTAGFVYMPARELANRQDGYYKIEVSVKSFRKARLQPAPAGG